MRLCNWNRKSNLLRALFDSVSNGEAISGPFPRSLPLDLQCSCFFGFLPKTLIAYGLNPVTIPIDSGQNSNNPLMNWIHPSLRATDQDVQAQIQIQDTDAQMPTVNFTNFSIIADHNYSISFSVQVLANTDGVSRSRHSV